MNATLKISEFIAIVSKWKLIIQITSNIICLTFLVRVNYVYGISCSDIFDTNVVGIFPVLVAGALGSSSIGIHFPLPLVLFGGRNLSTVWCVLYFRLRSCCQFKYCHQTSNGMHEKAV